MVINCINTEIGFQTCNFCKYSNSAATKKEDGKLLIRCKRRNKYVDPKGVCEGWRYLL